jgi:hypothetical protein
MAEVEAAIELLAVVDNSIFQEIFLSKAFRYSFSGTFVV